MRQGLPQGLPGQLAIGSQLRHASAPGRQQHQGIQVGAAVHHQQLAALVRAPDEADGRARAGLVVREAVIVGLGGRPTDRGAWGLSLSLAELELRHYGLVSRADGRMDLLFAAPGLHLGRGRQSWSLSLAPRYRLAWGAAGAQSRWAGVAGLRYGHSPTLE